MRSNNAYGVLTQLHDIARAQFAAYAGFDLLTHTHRTFCNHDLGRTARRGETEQFKQDIELDECALQWKIVNCQVEVPKKN